MLHWCLEAPPETERVWGGLCTLCRYSVQRYKKTKEILKKVGYIFGYAKKNTYFCSR